MRHIKTANLDEPTYPKTSCHMKLNASAPNAFAFTSALPLAGQWERAAVRRPRYKIKPFALGLDRSSLAQQDELAHKQEVVCAVILGLCLIFSLLNCMTQIHPL